MNRERFAGLNFCISQVYCKSFTMNNFSGLNLQKFIPANLSLLTVCICMVPFISQQGPPSYHTGPSLHMIEQLREVNLLKGKVKMLRS